MKIPNYDTKSPTQGRSLCKFLDEDFRLLISGQSGCGKTNTVMHILRKPLVYYDKIHFFPPNQHQDKIVDLQKVMKPISKKVGYEVLELHSPEEIMDTSEYPSNNRKVVVFDDLVNAPSSMIKRVLGQPNFSPQTNTTQLFPKINTNFNNLSSVKVNTNI